MKTLQDIQESIEHKYSKKFIEQDLLEILQSKYKENHAKGVEYMKLWLSDKSEYYPKKQARMSEIEALDLDQLVWAVMVQVAYCVLPELFTSVSAQLASRLGFNDKRDSIITAGEILAVVWYSDAYEICKPDKNASMTVVSKMELPQEFMDYAMNTEYLPPMVCPPVKVTNNWESGYLTHNDCLILGAGNAHGGEIGIDVINTQNAIPLSLNTEFLSLVEETPDFKTVIEGKDKLMRDMQWEMFKRQSHEMSLLMVKNGNKFYLTNKVDKRGRIYAQGYHISTQGTAYKKAMIELADKEVVQM